MWRTSTAGEVHTDVLDAPPTSTSRVEGLSRLGSVGGATIFNGPSFALTTRVPYVASPESWVTALIDYFNPLVGMQWTSPPSPQSPRNLLCSFSQLPAERSLLTISVVAAASDTGGHVSVGWVPHLRGGLPDDEDVVRYPIQGGDTEYTLDFTFERSGMAPPDFVMTLEPGIEWMLFNSVTLQTARRWSSFPACSDSVTRHIAAVTRVTIPRTITNRVSSARRARNQFAPSAKYR